MKARTEAALLAAPAMAILAGVAVLPVLAALWLSLHRSILIFHEESFIGIANFRFLVTDGRFWSALGTTAYFTAVAVGAEPKDVARYILRGGLILSLAGIGIGLGAAFALTRYMSSLIYGVSAFDPLTSIFVACLLIVVAAVASYVPAIRAAKIDPIEALRIE